jgi:transcriptional regulator with PAS, ATPase and Fis domain
VRGAFTSALQADPGLFVAANRGTMFLDEIGELPFTLQVKLLRVIENREVWPVGAKICSTG